MQKCSAICFGGKVTLLFFQLTAIRIYTKFHVILEIFRFASIQVETKQQQKSFHQIFALLDKPGDVTIAQ